MNLFSVVFAVKFQWEYLMAYCFNELGIFREHYVDMTSQKFIDMVDSGLVFSRNWSDPNQKQTRNI
jgi:hypothetical protein